MPRVQNPYSEGLEYLLSLKPLDPLAISRPTEPFVETSTSLEQSSSNCIDEQLSLSILNEPTSSLLHAIIRESSSPRSRIAKKEELPQNRVPGKSSAHLAAVTKLLYHPCYDKIHTYRCVRITKKMGRNPLEDPCIYTPRKIV